MITIIELLCGVSMEGIQIHHIARHSCEILIFYSIFLLSNSIKIFKEVRSGRVEGIKGLEKKFFGISKTFEVYLRPAL